MLDREGNKGLTLRGLAAELGGGLGSVYWYVKGKDELLDLVCDELYGRALAAALAEPAAGDGVPGPTMEVDLGTDDPEVLAQAARLRRLSLALYAQMEQHPWLAQQAQLSGAGRSNSMLVWEHMGRPLAAMGLTPRQQFHGSTALTGYVVGVSAEMASQHDAVDPSLSKDEQLGRITARWEQEESGELTWMRSISDEFRTHNDLEQFAAGLDLLILGLVRQAVG